MAKIKFSRKELKQDRFREEITHGVSYVSAHRTKILAWVIGGVVVLGSAIGGMRYYGEQRAEARRTFFDGVNKFNAKIELDEQVGRITFPTEATKFRETSEHFAQVADDFSGRKEGTGAQYYLALLEIDQGKTAEARERLEEVSQGDGEFAALGRVVLADLYLSEGENDKARILYQQLIDHPHRLVPKTRAQLGLVDAIADTDREQAMQLLGELRQQTGPIAIAAAGRLDRLTRSAPRTSAQ